MGAEPALGAGNASGDREPGKYAKLFSVAAAARSAVVLVLLWLNLMFLPPHAGYFTPKSTRLTLAVLATLLWASGLAGCRQLHHRMGSWAGGSAQGTAEVERLRHSLAVLVVGVSVLGLIVWLSGLPAWLG